MMFDSEVSAKIIEVKYLVVDALSSYDIVLGRLALKLLGAVLPTPNLNLKYPFLDGKVGVVRGD